MDDPRETRKIAANWREYLAETKESYRVYLWAWDEFVTPESRRLMARGILALTALIGLSMVTPWLMKFVFDGLAGKKNGLLVVGVMAGIYVLNLFQRFQQKKVDDYRQLSLNADLGRLDSRSSDLFFRKSLGQHMRDNGTLSPANVEKGRARVLETEHLIVYEGIPVLVEIALAFAFLWFASAVGGLIMTALLALYLAYSVRMNRSVIEECTPLDALMRKLNRHRVERWDNVDRVKTSGKETEEIAVMQRMYHEVDVPDTRFWLKMNGVGFVRGIWNTTAHAMVMGFGAWMVWKGEWTLGFLFPFYQWTDAISRNLWRIGNIERRINWNMPSVRSLMNALTLPPDAQDKPDAVALSPTETPQVEFVAVSHGYAEPGKVAGTRPQHVLKRVSFSVEPGEKVAILGPSGAGKTTIMRLLQRYMDPEQGSVRVGGHDLRDVQLQSWRRIVGYISQQTQILDGTLRYNLLYGLPEEEAAAMTDDELWPVAETLQIAFGERLTHGLQTVVGRRGIKLSGGEGQRVGVGAAVLKRPRFMIIDEATSSLDSTTEMAVQAGLAKLLPQETSALIITHRLSTVWHLCTKFVMLVPADQVRNGIGSQIDAIAGSLEELYAISAPFRRLADDQGLPLRSQVTAPQARSLV